MALQGGIGTFFRAEKSYWIATQAVQERAHLAEHGQGARETERLPEEDRFALVV